MHDATSIPSITLAGGGAMQAGAQISLPVDDVLVFALTASASRMPRNVAPLRIMGSLISMPARISRQMI
jgi:hypothetical protein